MPGRCGWSEQNEPKLKTYISVTAADRDAAEKREAEIARALEVMVSEGA